MAMSDEELKRLLDQINGGIKDRYGDMSLPEKTDGVDPADLEAARTSTVPSREMAFKPDQVKGSAEPGSRSTPAPALNSPAPKPLNNNDYRVPQGQGDNGDIENLLSRLRDAQGDDKEAARRHRDSMYALNAGGAMSTQMGGLPVVNNAIPAPYDESKDVSEEMRVGEGMRNGKSDRGYVAAETRNTNDKAEQSEFMLGDEKSERDPNSPASDLYRKIAKSVLEQNGADPSLVSDMHSAHDLKLAMPGLTQIVKKQIQVEQTSQKETQSVRHENRSDARTNEIVRGQLAGKVLGAQEAAANGAGAREDIDQQKYDIPGAVRAKPIKDTAYGAAWQATANRNTVADLSQKVIDILKKNPRPSMLDDDYTSMVQNLTRLFAVENKAEFHGVMRKYDQEWLSMQNQDPRQVLNWIRGQALPAMQEDLQNNESQYWDTMQAIGYMPPGAKKAPPIHGPNGSGSGGSGPYQDANILGPLENHVINGGPVPKLRSGRGVQPQPEVDPGTPDIPPQGETNEQRLRRKGLIQ